MKYLGNFGGRTSFIVLFSIFAISSVYFIYNVIAEEKYSLIIIAFLWGFIAYLTSIYSVIKYDSKKITVEKMSGKYTYTYSQFIKIEATCSVVYTFTIHFKDGKRYLFVKGNNAIGVLNLTNLKKDAAEMEIILRNNFTKEK